MLSYGTFETRPFPEWTSLAVNGTLSPSVPASKLWTYSAKLLDTRGRISTVIAQIGIVRHTHWHKPCIGACSYEKKKENHLMLWISSDPDSVWDDSVLCCIFVQALMCNAAV